MEYNNLYLIFDKISKSIENDENDKMDEIIKEFDIIYNDLNGFEYDVLFKLIYNNLDTSAFVIDFLNIFIAKYYFIKKLLFVEMINKFKNTDISKIKNFLLIDHLTFDYIFLLIKTLHFECIICKDIIVWLLYLGKNNLVYDIFDFCLENITNVKHLINISSIFIQTYLEIYSIYDNEISSNINFKIINFLHKKILLMYDKKILFESFSNIIDNIYDINYVLNPNYNNYNELIINTSFIKNIINFYLHSIKILYDINDNFDIDILINDILYFCNILNYDISNPNIVSEKHLLFESLPDLLASYNDIINIHSRVLILLKIKNVIQKSDDFTQNNLYIPKKLSYAIINFLSNVKFLEWSYENEKYQILDSIFKLLLLCVKNEKVFNFDNYYDVTKYDFIFYLYVYQKELFTLIKNELSNEINFINYTLKKEKIYSYCNLFGLSSHIEEYILNSEYYNIIPLELSYKFNLILDELICYRLDYISNNFNSNLYLDIIITNKIFLLDKYFNAQSFYYYGLTYENLLKYINKKGIKITDSMIKNINQYKIFLDISSEKINNLTNSEIIDPIFSIEIINPCMIPNSNEIFEQVTMKLLCRETQKNPISREKLTLEDLFKYNDSEEIKIKCKEFIDRKNLNI
jgi:hypothetical protein